MSSFEQKLLDKVEHLERQLEEAREDMYKYAEIALMEGKDEFGYSWEDFKHFVLDEQLKGARPMSLIDKARESETNSYFKLEEDYQSLVDHAQDLKRQLEASQRECERLREIVEGMDLFIEAETQEAWSNNCFDREITFVEMSLKLRQLTAKSEGGGK